MKDRLLDLAGSLAGRRVLVIGDTMLDRYLWGEATRISPEAPVPVVRVEREEFQPGGAGNVMRNLCALGMEPVALGVVGSDHFGETLRGRLELLGARIEGLMVADGLRTTVKTRVIAGGQQMLRIDQEDEADLPDDLVDEIAGRGIELLGSADGVIFSDYAKGVASDQVVRRITEAGKAARKPVLADAKPAGFARYDGITLLTPNEQEAHEAAGLQGMAGASLEELAKALCAEMRLQALVVTRDARGMLLVEAGGDIHHLPGLATEVVDVTGAGDTVLSVMTGALLAGATMLEAAALANLAGGVVVRRVGCATVTVGELRDEIRARGDDCAGPTP